MLECLDGCFHDLESIFNCHIFSWNQDTICHWDRCLGIDDSVLKKKSNEVCYHYARESVAMGESIMTHVPTHENVADICTKVIPVGATRDRLVSALLWNTNGAGEYNLVSIKKVQR
jgi:hypothetical protein